MLAIHRVRRLPRPPLAILPGLVLMAAGGVLDVVVHLSSVSHHADASFGGEHLAHLIGIAGMVLVLAGVVAHGARRHRRQRAAATEV